MSGDLGGAALVAAEDLAGALGLGEARHLTDRHLAAFAIAEDHFLEILASRGLKQVSASSALPGIVDEVIGINPTQVQQYLDADDARRKKLLGFFVGQVMKLSKGQANPKMGNEVRAKTLA